MTYIVLVPEWWTRQGPSVPLGQQYMSVNEAWEQAAQLPGAEVWSVIPWKCVAKSAVIR